MKEKECEKDCVCMGLPERLFCYVHGNVKERRIWSGREHVEEGVRETGLGEAVNNGNCDALNG